jgi:hypothetical protein
MEWEQAMGLAMGMSRIMAMVMESGLAKELALALRT